MATKAKQINIDPTPHISAKTNPTVLWSSCIYVVSDAVIFGCLPRKSM